MKGAGGRRGADVGADVGAAYDASASAWGGRPSRVYARLSAALLDTAAPRLVAGARVLDLGAGTGVASVAALERGAASVVATDLATRMLHRVPAPVRAVVGDAARLPFPDGSFDLVTAAMVLGHLPDPLAAAREARRVAPALLASAFDPDWSHPAKVAVDAAMAQFGFEVPGWYRQIKEHAAAVEDPVVLTGLARDAGYEEVRVARVEVDAGLEHAGAVVEWRWGMAHLAPFVATLTPVERARARRAAEDVVAGMPPVVVPLLVLSAC